MIKLNIIFNKDVKVCCIELPSEFTSIITDEYRREVGLCMAKGIGYYIFDFSHVKFIDSAGIGAIISTAKRVRSMKGDIKLAAMQASALNVFKMIHADRYIELYDSVDDAMDSFSNTSTYTSPLNL